MINRLAFTAACILALAAIYGAGFGIALWAGRPANEATIWGIGAYPITLAVAVLIGIAVDLISTWWDWVKAGDRDQ